MGKSVNIAGMKFGRLTAIEMVKPFDKDPRRKYWRCKCQCGNECVVEQSNLRSGLTRSCGCLHAEVWHKIVTKHGKHGCRLYRIWKHMRERCYSEKCKAYINYGARGIIIDEIWKDNFNNFYEWAIHNGYKNYLTIERVDNDGPYSPSNCIWADRMVQRRNTRPSTKKYLNGTRLSLKELSQKCGIRAGTLQYRLSHGYSIEVATTIPVGKLTRSAK